MVYVVTTGEYSDYEICGIFSTKELAQLYYDKLQKTGKDLNDIEEYLTDDPELVNDTVVPYWRTQIEIISGESHQSDHWCLQSEVKCRKNNGVPNYESLNNKYGACQKHISVDSFVSKNHSAKLAAEKRQEFLRHHPLDTIKLKGDWSIVKVKEG